MPFVGSVPAIYHAFVIVSIILYFHSSDHSVTAGVVKNMLLNVNTFSVTLWRIFIQSWRSGLCQDYRRCGPHFFHLFIRWRSKFRDYLDRVMMCAAWVRLPMRYSRLSLFIFVKARHALVSLTQAVSFSLGKNARRERVWMSHTRQVLRSTSWPSTPILWSERGTSCFSSS